MFYNFNIKLLQLTACCNNLVKNKKTRVENSSNETDSFLEENKRYCKKYKRYVSYTLMITLFCSKNPKIK